MSTMAKKRFKPKIAQGRGAKQHEHDRSEIEKLMEPDHMKPVYNTMKIFSRAVAVVTLVSLVFYSSNEKNLVPMAKQTEILAGKGIIVDCSPEYTKEINNFEGCFPRECGRFVTDKVITQREVDDLISIAKKGFKHGGSDGGASILDLHSGALSEGQHFINIFKKEDANNLFTDKDFTVYRVVKDKIKFAVAHHFQLEPDKIYLTHPTFFSQITNKPAATVHDEYWHPHVDKETYKSFHYTTLLYLGDYDIDFKGGRFIFMDNKANRTVEPRKGRVSMFTSGAENLHRVEQVIFGTRYAMTISFTCDPQFAIQDPSTKKYLE